MVTAQKQRETETRAGFSISAVKGNRPTGQRLNRALHVGQTAFLKNCGCLKLRHYETPISSGERGVEVSRLLKEPLCDLIIILSSLAQMPQATLISRPS